MPQKYVSFKRRTRNYRKRRPAITFIPPRVNTFSANGITAGFIPTTEVSIGISRSPTIQLIHSQLKLVGLILTMRFRYGMCMCIGVRMRGYDLYKFVRLSIITKTFFGTRNLHGGIMIRILYNRWTVAYCDHNTQQN